MSELQTGQQEIFDYVKTNLGDGMIDVELDPKHYQTALERAINRYRQRSSNAVEESYAFLDLKENQNKYTSVKTALPLTKCQNKLSNENCFCYWLLIVRISVEKKLFFCLKFAKEQSDKLNDFSSRSIH